MLLYRWYFKSVRVEREVAEGHTKIVVDIDRAVGADTPTDVSRSESSTVPPRWRIRPLCAVHQKRARKQQASTAVQRDKQPVGASSSGSSNDAKRVTSRLGLRAGWVGGWARGVDALTNILTVVRSFPSRSIQDCRLRPPCARAFFSHCRHEQGEEALTTRPRAKEAAKSRGCTKEDYKGVMQNSLLFYTRRSYFTLQKKQQHIARKSHVRRTLDTLRLAAFAKKQGSVMQCTS